MTDRYRIAVVDDHPLVRSGVVKTLEKQPDFEIVGEGGSCDEAVRLAQDELPDAILLDISMPGGGISAAKVIAASCPAVKIVFLTVAEDETTISSALECGARGYILKGVRSADLIGTLRKILEGDAVVLPGMAARLLASVKQKSNERSRSLDLISQLTAREAEILKLLATGKSNRDIGLELAITERTVKHYMSNILQKLHVRNRVAAALLAERELLKKD